MPAIDPPPRWEVPLLAVAHGTGDPRGLACLDALMERIRFLRPDLEVRLAFVSVAAPSAADALARFAAEGVREVVVLPLLLGSGYHVNFDIPKAISSVEDRAAEPGAPAAGRLRVVQADALGPHPRLVDALADRLHQVGGTVFGTQVVLAAAGSKQQRANADAVAMASLLAERLRVPVRTAFLTTAAPDLTDTLVRLVRRGRPVAVATYLLAPGDFSRRIEEAAALASREIDSRRPVRVSEPLGAHDRVAKLALHRYDCALHDKDSALNRSSG